MDSEQLKEQASSGWYDGGQDQNCNTGCQQRGLVCTDDQLFAHNSAVDSSSDVLTLMNQVGAISSATSCNGAYGTSPGIPEWNHGGSDCYYSQPLRALSSFSCSAIPTQGFAKHRLCYCHESPAPTFSSASRGRCVDSNGAEVMHIHKSATSTECRAQCSATLTCEGFATYPPTVHCNLYGASLTATAGWTAGGSGSTLSPVAGARATQPISSNDWSCHVKQAPTPPPTPAPTVGSWHLAPSKYTVCDSGVPATQEQCEGAVHQLTVSIRCWSDTITEPTDWQRRQLY